MKVISLAQPYASMLIAGYKKWETRLFKPGERNLAIIRKEGLLIHASTSKKFDHMIDTPPFNKYRMELPRGYIIGVVQLGRIMTTDNWRAEHGSCNGEPYDRLSSSWSPNTPEILQERLFGDYGENRWCWETVHRMQLQTPIFVKGALSIWDYALSQNIIDLWNVC